MTVDSLGIEAVSLALPEQIETALAAVREVGTLPSAEGIDNVVVMGMGGSGISGDVVAAVAGPALNLPVVVVKGYGCPAFVGPRSLVVAVSFSGNTEETLEAVEAARERGANVLVVTAGGALGEAAVRWGWPVLPVDGSLPMPRTALAAVSVPILWVLDRMGLLTDVEGELRAAVAQLATRRDALGGPGDPVTGMAERLLGAPPVIYGSGAIGGTAARRWKAQLNENAKIVAYSNEMPELCHNEIAVWSPGHRPPPATVVHLRLDDEHHQIARRFDYHRRLVSESGFDVVECRGQGPGPLTQLFDLMYLGDLVSLEVARRLGVDPGPIVLLEDLKAHLARG